MIEFGVAGGDVGTQRVRTIFGQQALAFALDAKVGAEVTAAVHDVLRGVVQVGGAGVLEFGRAVAGPGQTEVIATGVVTGFLVDATLGLQGLDVEQVHVAHVGLQALRALAGVADGPHATVDFAQDVFRHGLVHAFDFLHLVVLDQLFVEAQFLRQLVHDHVVAAALPQGFDDLFAPLDRAVRCRARTTGLELGGRGQQIHRALGVQVFGLAGHGRHGGGG